MASQPWVHLLRVAPGQAIAPALRSRISVANGFPASFPVIRPGLPGGFAEDRLHAATHLSRRMTFDDIARIALDDLIDRVPVHILQLLKCLENQRKLLLLT